MPLEWLGSRSHELTTVHERGAAWSSASESSRVAGVVNSAAAAGALVQPPPAELYVLDTVAPRVPMDRDLVVAWRPQVGVAPAVAALTETIGETTYALLMILPPAAAHAARSQPREQIYVIDTSGSMGGQSIVQAKAALLDALGRLTSADRFNVIQFDSTTSSLYPAPQAVLARDSRAGAALHRRAHRRRRHRDRAGDRGRARATDDRRLPAADRLHHGWRRRPRKRGCSTRSRRRCATRACSRRHRLGAELVLHAQGRAIRPRHLYAHRRHGEVTEKMTALFAKLERVALARRRRRLARGRRAVSARNPGRLRRRAARANRKLSGDSGSAVADDGVRSSGRRCRGGKRSVEFQASCRASQRYGRDARSST